MGAEDHQAAQADPGDPAALAGRLFRDMTGALELFTVYLGERLGLYQALCADGPATFAELAARTGTVERYVREWLEHHATSGLLEVDDPAAGPMARRYRLPPGHVPVLADTGDVRYQAFNGTEIVRAARWMPEVAEAFRSGGAPPPLPWAPEGRPEFNRAVFLNLLAREWLPAIADVDQRLRREPPARVADLACGTGWSSIAMAQAYPLIDVDGFDLDADAISAARRNAGEAGLADRVTFTAADASGPGVQGQYDLVTILEALHDMSRPVDALRVARGLLAEPGIIRNRLKIEATIENARRIQALRQSHGSFDTWLDAHHPRSQEDWTRLFRQTFRFTGGQIVNEFLMSLGYLPGAHAPDCPIFTRILDYSPPWTRGAPEFDGGNGSVTKSVRD